MKNSHRSFHARTLLRTRNHVGFRNRSHVSTTSNRKNASFCEIIRGQRIGSHYDYYEAKRSISTIRFLEPRNASGIESLSDDCIINETWLSERLDWKLCGQSNLTYDVYKVEWNSSFHLLCMTRLYRETQKTIIVELVERAKCFLYIYFFIYKLELALE